MHVKSAFFYHAMQCPLPESTQIFPGKALPQARLTYTALLLGVSSSCDGKTTERVPLNLNEVILA